MARAAFLPLKARLSGSAPAIRASRPDTSNSTVPTVGASGAIAGVLGAYLISFPRSRVVTFIPIIIFPWIVEIPAVAYLVIWFAMQLLSGVASLGQAEALGLALAGVAILFYLMSIVQWHEHANH